MSQSWRGHRRPEYHKENERTSLKHDVDILTIAVIRSIGKHNIRFYVVEPIYRVWTFHFITGACIYLILVGACIYGILEINGAITESQTHVMTFSHS